MFGRSKQLFTPPAINVPGEGDLYVKFETTMGTMVAKLHEELAPRTVANFVYLVTGKYGTEEPYYDGIQFHRVIPDFMIQGGCPLGQGTGGPGYSIECEFHPSLRHDRPGLLSMANAGPNTGGSQFFFTEVATPWLDNKHAIFGEVIEGVEHIAEITSVPRDARDRPREPITMTSVTVYRA